MDEKSIIFHRGLSCCIHSASTHHLFMCLFIHLTSSYPSTHIPTWRVQPLPQWHSHSRQGDIPCSSQHLHILSVTREIPILALPRQQSRDSRLFQWRGIPPSTQTHTQCAYTHTHTHSYIFTVMRSDSISQPVKRPGWFDMSYCLLIHPSLSLNPVFNTV